MKPHQPHILGKIGEDQACQYLQQQGLQLLERNYFRPAGEIDLIMQDKNMIVFVEVRMRNQQHLMSGLESITRSKQRKIIRTATLYLQEHHLLNKIQCRFDVVSIDQLPDKYDFQWIQNAFEP